MNPPGYRQPKEPRLSISFIVRTGAVALTALASGYGGGLFESFKLEKDPGAYTDIFGGTGMAYMTLFLVTIGLSAGSLIAWLALFPLWKRRRGLGAFILAIFLVSFGLYLYVDRAPGDPVEREMSWLRHSQNRDYPTHSSALVSMGRKAVPRLIHALDDPSYGVPEAAARILGQMGTEAHEAIPSLTRILYTGDPGLRYSAAHALAKIGDSDASAREKLNEAIKSTDPAIRLPAVKADHDFRENPLY